MHDFVHQATGINITLLHKNNTSVRHLKYDDPIFEVKKNKSQKVVNLVKVSSLRCKKEAQILAAQTPDTDLRATQCPSLFLFLPLLPILNLFHITINC